MPSTELGPIGTATCSACGWEVRWLVAPAREGVLDEGDIAVTPWRRAAVVAEGDPPASTHAMLPGQPSVIHVPADPRDHVVMRARQDRHVYRIERRGRVAVIEVDPCR